MDRFEHRFRLHLENYDDASDELEDQVQAARTKARIDGNESGEGEGSEKS
jgi:hypothetical protein